MSTKVLLHDHPHRTLALATDDYALIFRHSHPGTEQGYNASSPSLPLPPAGRQIAPRCMLEFAPRSSLDLHGYRTVITAKGTLGLITLNNDVFICVVTGSTEVATVRPGETVQKIYAVEFYCLNRSDYDNIHGQDINPYPGQTFSSDEAESGSAHDQSDSTAEHPFHALKKLLNSGNFYYSVDFDLTRRLQERAGAETTVDIASLDEGLLWNSYMISPLIQFRSRLTNHEREALDHSRMLTSVIRGFVKTLNVPSSSNPLRRKVSSQPSLLTVISRLSSRRAGTRFNSRGVDDDGNVANFVETDTVFWSPTGLCFSYTQIRGSIPIFWESTTSLIPGQQKIQITRSPEATQPAFDRHFDALERVYGAVHIVNLLSASKPGEVELTERYRHHISRSPLRQTSDASESSDHHLLKETEFDFHERARLAGGYDGAKSIRPYLEASAESFVYFLSEEVEEKVSVDGRMNTIKRPIVIMQQNGIFRVNCLDCLDRTNLIQTLISQMALESFLAHRGEGAATSDFWMRHSSLWADNGDTLSKIYAGTGALKSSFTRHGKMSLAGAIADARKSATRLYVNNFTDKSRQNTIDLLLGRLMGQTPVFLYDPVGDFVTKELERRAGEYTASEPVYMWCGTFNLNGKLDGLKEDLGPWLHAKSRGFGFDYEIVCVGFQEIVELNPNNIMSTDPSVRMLWEKAVKESLNSNPHRFNPDDDYVLLRSGQLVGCALMVFVKASVLGRIKNVEGSIRKTGMSGIAGNKGAVAIRFEFGRTSLCCVTAHLAAGFANYEERNRDYRTISEGLRFGGGSSEGTRFGGIEDHDCVVWVGDFNYRIGLGHERAVGLVEKADLETLYANDQLNIQMVAGMAFPFYNESRIGFAPTYKFDVGTDRYDSSEKGRIPAWCDRVVWKKGNTGGGIGMRQLEYGSCAELKFSDHRPVFATFELGVVVVDEAKKGRITAEIERKRRGDVDGALSGKRRTRGTLTGSDDDDDDDEGSEGSADADDLMGYESIAEGLPPASSDRRKWWLDGDRAVRSNIGPPKPGMVLNEKRNGNPWREGNGGGNGEDDWVEVERGVNTNVEGVTSRALSHGGNRATSVGSKAKSPPPVPQARGARRMVVPVYEGERLARQASEKVQQDEAAPHGHHSGFGSLDGVVEKRASSRKRDPSMPPPPPPPHTSGPRTRTDSNASSISSTPDGRKLPPPKPSKPSSLVGVSSQVEVPQLSPLPSAMQIRSTAPAIEQDEETPPPLPRRTDTTDSMGSGRFFSATESQPQSPVVERRLPPPVQPRRVNRLQAEEVAGRSGSPSRGSEEERPALPPRRPVNKGLMDEEVGDAVQEMDAWKPLIPK